MANSDQGNSASSALLKARRDAIAKLLETPGGQDIFNASEADRQKFKGEQYDLAQARNDAWGFVNNKGQLNSSDSTWDILGAIPFLAAGSALAGQFGATAGTGGTGAAAPIAAEGGSGVLGAAGGTGGLGAAGTGASAAAPGLGGLVGSAAIPSITVGPPAGWAAGGLSAGQIGAGAAGLAGTALAGSGATAAAPTTATEPAKTPEKSTYEQIKGGLQTANNTKNAINAIGSLTGQNGGNMATGGTTTTQQTLDPRIAAMLFGENGNQGLLSQYQALGQQPQSGGSAAIGGAAQGWLQNDGNNILHQLYGGASNLMGSNIAAPQGQAAMSQAATGQAATGQATLGQAATGQAALGQAAQTTNQPQSQTVGSAPPPGANVLWNYGEQVNAPAQNNLNLTSSYDKFINGDPGANPYLTGAIQKGINQASSAFQSQQADSTRNLRENILPGIRSNSVLSGQYGSSRQGIAEGRALGDFGREQQRALSQFGQNATDAAVAAQSQSFNQGQDRALSATQGLGAQQYGVASQNSGQNQQANLANQSASNQTQQFNANLAQNANNFNVANQQQNNQFNAGLGQQTNLANLGNQQQQNLANQSYQNQFGMANLGNQQQSNLANQGFQNQFGMANLGNQQQSNLANLGNQQQTGLANQGASNQMSLANLQAMLGTNSLNSANQATGLQGLSGLLSQIYGYGQNQDNYGLNKAQQTNNLLAPYLSANSGQTTQSPVYSNTAGNILGGAAAGLGLYNQFANLGSSGGNLLGNFASNNAGVMQSTGLGLNDLLSAFGG